MYLKKFLTREIAAHIFVVSSVHVGLYRLNFGPKFISNDHMTLTFKYSLFCYKINKKFTSNLQN